MIIILDGDEAGSYLRYLARNPPTQESGQCLDLDLEGSDCLCTRDGLCPYLDVEGVTCPVKSDLVEMAANLRSRPVYETAAPEWVEPEPEEAPFYTTPARPKSRAPAHVKEWTAEEDAAIRDATTAAESVTLYRSAVPDSGRSDAAIRVRWYKKVRPGLAKTRDSLPDFDGDVAPVTQCEEPETPGDREQTPYSWLGMRVRVLDPLDLANRTGTVIQCNVDTPEMLVALDDAPDRIAPDRIWLPPESLLLIGAGRRSP